ncbi:MAG: addiction module protein [Dehalococcoidia bacterium]
MTRVEELLEQVKALSEDEQDEFRMLYEGVCDEPGLSPEWQAEIRRRVEEVENGTARTRTWDEVKAALRTRIDAAKVSFNRHFDSDLEENR